MTTTAKIAIAAVIVAALAAVIGYDLMYGKPKPGAGNAETAPRNDSGLTLLTDPPARSPGEIIGDAERREGGTGTVNAPATGSESTTVPSHPPPPPVETAPANEEYVVQSGETLADIAERKYGDQNKWTVIAKANPGVNPNRMRIGTKLVLPSEAATVQAVQAAETAAAEAAAPPEDGRPRTYTIQAGDVLSKIAKKFYGSAAAAARIQEANPEALKDADFLIVGSKIVLPEAPARAPVTVSTGEPGTSHTTARVDPAQPTGRTHAVARGESLWKIAEKHHGGIGVLAYMDKLVAANPDKLASKNTALRTGWVLALPDSE
ncbi:MAG TPA: LysM peptidoglycan-binding domain-containing protein [Planctomycetota bacterium]|nr:LysM peptidoglycan-binding domain-containing protein [Planctomycetota bacterium]